MAPLDRRQLLATLAGAAGGAAVPRLAFAEASPMLRRAIPHSQGETLPVIGLGTARAFNVGNDAAKRKELGDVVAELLAARASLIDTASSYGSSEEVVGAVATGTPSRDKIFIATKLEERDGPAAQAEFAQSLKRLGVDRVDLLQMHNVRAGDPGLGFFRGLQAGGRVRYVGATTTFKDDYAAMERLIRADKPDFIEVDCSIANRDAQDRIIPAAADVGAAVLIAIPLGKGGLFGKVKGKPLPPLARELGAETWGQVFLKYLLGNPAITAVIPATDNPKHMADNLAAGRGPMPDDKQRRELVSYFEGLG